LRLRSRSSGKFDEALNEIKLTRAIAQSRFGTSHLNYARALALEAQVHLAKGDTANAIPLQKQALEIREAQTPPNPLLIALGLSELAESYTRAGDFRNALFYRTREEKVVSEALQNASHPKLAAIQKTIGQLEEKLRSTGQREKAK
jgi:hypothetical protein